MKPIKRDALYCIADAGSRLIGTLLSGLSYQIGGLPLCLATAGLMAAASWLVARGLAHACPPARVASIGFGADVAPVFRVPLQFATAPVPFGAPGLVDDWDERGDLAIDQAH